MLDRIKEKNSSKAEGGIARVHKVGSLRGRFKRYLLNLIAELEKPTYRVPEEEWKEDFPTFIELPKDERKEFLEKYRV